MKTCPKCLTQFQPQEGKRGRPYTLCPVCRPPPRVRKVTTAAPPVAQAEAASVQE